MGNNPQTVSSKTLVTGDHYGVKGLNLVLKTIILKVLSARDFPMHRGVLRYFYKSGKFLQKKCKTALKKWKI